MTKATQDVWVSLLAVMNTTAQAQESGLLANEQVKELAKDERFVNAGKTEFAIRSKAVSAGIYQKATTAKKVGNPSTTRKVEHVHHIETMLGLEKGALASFEKGNKLELEKASQALNALSDRANAESE